ncbi:MAG: hypothetical protein Q8N96_04795 [Methylovulum sp.]|nr:hypothetical protein [Methylovulum sp.]
MHRTLTNTEPAACVVRGAPKMDDDTQATPRMTQTHPTVRHHPVCRCPQKTHPSCGFATEAQTKPKNCPQP